MMLNILKNHTEPTKHCTKLCNRTQQVSRNIKYQYRALKTQKPRKTSHV